jgi:methionyl-tRNA synthetase
MKIEQIEPDKLEPAFGILMATAQFGGKLGERPRIGVAWGVVPPGGATTAHRHDEFEMFVILEGAGRILTDNGEARVGPGQSVLFDPFELHTLHADANAAVKFVTVYWRDAGQTARGSKAPAARLQGPVFVASTPPTPNGDLHLGHVSGPYLGADIHRRYLRMRGIAAYHVTGSDDYQSYTEAKARQMSVSPQEAADKFANLIAGTLQALDIEVDQFTRSSRTRGYHEAALAFLGRLQDAGAVTRASMPALFEPDTGAYLYEVDVVGRCPACRTPTSGNICEQCGSPNMCTDLIEPRSKRSGRAPLEKAIERLHFRLPDYLDEIRRHHAEARMGTRLRTLIETLASRGILEVAVSHPAEWGIPVGRKGPEGQVVWAWLEMIVGFLIGIRAIRAPQAAGEADVELPADGRIVHFFGYDNAFYHTVLFPAALRAAYPERELKIDYVFNEFYLLDGAKFSTSRGHAVWGREILAHANADAVRFFLCHTRPETERTNFTWMDFDRVIRDELIGEWQAWIADLDRRVADAFGRVAPDAGVWTQEQREFFDRLQWFGETIADSYEVEGFSPQRATRLLCELVRESRRFAAAERHWHDCSSQQSFLRTSVALELAAARQLALLAAPLMPAFSRHLLAGLGEQASEPLMWPEYPAFPTPGTTIRVSADFRYRMQQAAQ